MSTDASGGGRPAAERLRELQRLHDDGLISDEECEALRARILDEAFGPAETETTSGSGMAVPRGSAAYRPSDQVATASSLPEDQPKPDPPGQSVVNLLTPPRTPAGRVA